MGDQFRQIRSGEPVQAGSPIVSAKRNNLLTQIAKERLGGKLPTRGVINEDVEAGSTLIKGMLYDNLPGYSRDGINISVNTSKFLPYVATDSGYTVDLTASFIEVEPIFGSAIELASGSCCGNNQTDQSSITGSDITINTPINVNGFVNSFEGEDESLSLAGGGVDSQSSVEIRILNPTNSATLSGPHSANVANDGTWSATIDFSADITSDGVFLIQATETDIDNFVHKPIVVPFMRGEYNSVAQGTQLETPPPPDLIQDSDTGDRNDDNVTDDDTPTFFLNKGASVYDASGMTPVLYVDGVEVARGSFNDFATVSSLEMTIVASLSAGSYAISFALINEEGNSGETFTGQSEPLYIKVVSSFASTGEITATCEANGAFSESDDPIGIKNTVIINTTDPPQADPATPSTIPQPDQPFAGPDGYPMKLRWDGSAWQLQSTGKYGREALIGTIDGVQSLLIPGPCPIEITHAENAKLLS